MVGHRQRLISKNMSEDFINILKDNYFVLIYGITLLVSLIKYSGYFDTVLKYFPILIAYTFLNELLGYLVKNNPNFSFFKNANDSSINEIIYNIYAIVFFVFFYYVYWNIISKKEYRKKILIAAIISFLSFLISSFFQNPNETNLFYATAISSWILVFCVILYFKNKKINNEKIIQPKNLMFWVSISLLVFYSVFPILYLIGYLNYEIWDKYHLLTVLRILIIAMYSILTIGFLKSARRAFG